MNRSAPLVKSDKAGEYGQSEAKDGETGRKDGRRDVLLG